MQVRPLNQGDLLEEEMATHSSILAWKIPWTEEPLGYCLWSCKELDTFLSDRIFTQQIPSSVIAHSRKTSLTSPF